jgi:hypothetical protein
MFILSDENKSLKAKTAVAPATALDFIVTYNDSGTINAVKGNKSGSGTINNVPSIILAPPQDRISRDVRSINIFNTDNITHTVSVYYQDGINSRSLYVAELLVGERVEFEWDKGWQVYDSKGLKKESLSKVRIHVSTLANAVLTDIYTVPTGKNARVCIVVSNLAGANKSFRIAISPLGAVIANQHYTHYGRTLSGNDTHEDGIYYELMATDVVRVYGSDANVAFTVNGIEY